MAMLWSIDDPVFAMWLSGQGFSATGEVEI
jgi:hypothetical protein